MSSKMTNKRFKKVDAHKMPNECEKCSGEQECDLNWSYSRLQWLCDECHDPETDEPDAPPSRNFTYMMKSGGFIKTKVDGQKFWAQEVEDDNIFLMWKRYKDQEVLQGRDFVGRYNFSTKTWETQ